jgi:hypothetical protein
VFNKSFVVSVLMVFVTTSLSDATSYPYLHSGIHASNEQKYYRNVLQQIKTKYPIPIEYFSGNPQQTKYHDLGDGSVVAYGEKYQVVNIPIMGVNRLVTLTLQYAVKIPSFAVDKKLHKMDSEVTNRAPYAHDATPRKEEIEILPPTPPIFDNVPGTIDFLPLIDNRLLSVLKQNEGNSFHTKPSLGQVPVVRPGSVRPFSLFWYLPVNPQIQIDTKKVIKNGNRLHNPLINTYQNPIFVSTRPDTVKPMYRPPVFIPITHFAYPASKDNRYTHHIRH